MRASAILAIAVAGCASPPPCGGEAGALPVAPCVAVMRTDYLSSAITFADCDGHLLAPSWIDSGTVVGSLVTSVSYDAVLIEAPGGVGWIDRSIDTLTLAALTPDELPSFVQIDVRGSASGTIANPHDAAWLPDGRALVTRYGGSPDAAGGLVSDDVVILADGAIVQRLEPTLARTTDVHARPDEIVVLGDPPAVALVSLGRASNDFMTFEDGMVAVVSLGATPTIEALLDIPGLQNCGPLRRDPGDPNRAYLLCIAGYLRPAEERRPHAGIVELTHADGDVGITATASVPAPHQVPGVGLVALGGRRVLVVGTGSATQTSIPDELLEVSLATGEVTLVERAGSGFVLGDGVLVASTGRVLVPDAESSSIWVIDRAVPARVVERVSIDDCIELPPRALLAL